MQDKHIKVRCDYDMPSAKNSLQRYLGIMRNFIPNLAGISNPLGEVLKKNVNF